MFISIRSAICHCLKNTSIRTSRGYCTSTTESPFKSIYNIFDKYKFKDQKLSNDDLWITPQPISLSTSNPINTNYQQLLMDRLKSFDAVSVGTQLVKSKSKRNSNLVEVHIDKVKMENKEYLDDFANHFSIYPHKYYKDSVIWSQQLLPNAKEIVLPRHSNKKLDEITFDYLFPILSFLSVYHQKKCDSGENELPFSFMIQSTVISDHKDEEILEKLSDQSRSLRSSIIQRIERTRKRLLKGMVDYDCDSSVLKDKSPYLVQLLLVNTHKVYVSVNRLTYSQEIGWGYPLPFLNGTIPMKRDQTHPSRAYKKLLEVFGILGYTPSGKSTCVDLGSAPGGWISLLLQINPDLRILSCDRSSLVNSLERNANVKHFIDDGSQWFPEEKVDWLFNDMAMPPPKSLETLEKWLKRSDVHHFVWAVKFVTSTDHQKIFDQIHGLMRKLKIEKYFIKHLLNQGNEIMIVGCK
ncbi:hypothetical protein DLAC_07584 [Tieghemostelium lacteum]|uniref:Ribosomal RNA methyltransferase FtsJ domain-containing protein n=1 Tax=Tieghemostelium lacteum TaxID=361077 RepID=A0A151ZCY4_TIELA|nr:hypothetical protein DLAC_07584 [Tieghemostelium lacteum]|eukprot:KYQ91789.1 hypothetical protein DLAC_07584 [Tieghemostelium lacteum]